MIIVQGLWIGSSLSTMEQLSIHSFLQNGHEYHLYAYEKVRNVPEKAVLKDANEVIPSEKIFKSRGSYTAFSNLFRYALLLNNGGLWADLDVVCLKPLVFNSPYVFSEEKTDPKSKRINNNVLQVPKNSELMKFCFDTAAAAIPDRLVWGQTGPELMTRAVANFGLQEFAYPPRTFNPVDWWKWKDILSGSNLTSWKLQWIIQRKAYAVHLWNEMWRREKLEKDSQYPAKCLYEKLKRKYLAQ